MTQPTLAMVPSGYKDGKLYSVLPTDGVGDFDVTRGSDATRVNKDGLIETVTSNVPRLDYTGGGCPNLLLEPQSTNVVPYSQVTTGWTLSNVTEIQNDFISPDGTLNASKFTTSALAVNIKFQTVTVNPETTYTYSFYCNYVGGDGLQGRFYDNTNGANIEFYNYDNQLEEGEWKRVTRTFTTPVGCTNIQIWYLALSSTFPVIASYWGAQLEQSPYPTSYIPTNGNTATRLAETTTASGNAAAFNDSEGVLFADISAFSEVGSAGLISVSNQTATKRVTIELDGNIIKGRMTPSVGILNSSTNITFSNKIAFKYKQDDFALWVNGLEVAVINSGNTFSGGILDELAFDRGDGFEPFYGNIKQIQYYPTADFTDAELAKLTTI